MLSIWYTTILPVYNVTFKTSTLISSVTVITCIRVNLIHESHKIVLTDTISFLYSNNITKFCIWAIEKNFRYSKPYSHARMFAAGFEGFLWLAGCWLTSSSCDLLLCSILLLASSITSTAPNLFSRSMWTESSSTNAVWLLMRAPYLCGDRSPSRILGQRLPKWTL